MISNLSERLADKLLLNQSISKEERELYVYGFYIMFSHLFYLVLASIFGLFFGCILESIVFYLVFQFIRRSAGGYHASTETRCQIISTLSIFASIAFIRISTDFDFQIYLLILTSISAIAIFCLCPLDTPEKPLSKNETYYFRKKIKSNFDGDIFDCYSCIHFEIGFSFCTV